MNTKDRVRRVRRALEGCLAARMAGNRSATDYARLERAARSALGTNSLSLGHGQARSLWTDLELARSRGAILDQWVLAHILRLAGEERRDEKMQAAAWSRIAQAEEMLSEPSFEISALTRQI